MNNHLNRISELRERRGWSQEQLGCRVNPPTSKGQIYQLEKGKRKLTQDWIIKLSNALECEPAEILLSGKSEQGGFVATQERQLLADCSIIMLKCVQERGCQVDAEQIIALAVKLYDHCIKVNQRPTSDLADLILSVLGERYYGGER